MESFFALLQRRVPNRRSWATRMKLRIGIVVRIKQKYHRNVVRQRWAV